MEDTDVSEESILKGLKELRYDWSDEIPGREIHNKGMLKVRKGWSHAVYSLATVAELEGFLSKFGIKAYERYESYRKNKSSGRLTTKEDIEEGNRLLDIMIRDMQRRIKH
jgi:hypothetical protein